MLPMSTTLNVETARHTIPAFTGGVRGAVGDVIDLRDDTEGRRNSKLVVQSVNPAWLRGVCGWHQAGRSAGPILADLGLAGLALSLAGSTAVGISTGVAVLLLTGLLFGLWKRRLPYETQGILWYGRHLTPAAAAVGLALAVGQPSVTTDQVALATISMSLALIGIRAALWLTIASARRNGLGLQAALVIGSAKRIDQIQHRLLTYPEAGLRYAASFIPVENERTSPESGRRLVNDLLGEYPVDHVLCVPDRLDETVFLDFVRFSKGQVDVTLVLPIATLSAGQLRSSIGDLGVLPLRLRPSWGSVAAKRVFDVVASVLALMVLSPILLASAAAIWISDRGPVLFRQKRVGRDGKQFTIFKFRSMVVDAEQHQLDYTSRNFANGGLLFKLEDDPRVTPVGAVLRRLSIDELPQLLNIVRGDMSLVGPRPLPVKPEDFDIRAQIRHQASPGVTGLWQALGANILGYEDMLDLDLAYVATRSFGVDVLTLLRTIPAVLNRRSPA